MINKEWAAIVSHKTVDGFFSVAVLNSALVGSTSGHTTSHRLEGVADTMYAEAD